jgi:hypothetical protein
MPTQYGMLGRVAEQHQDAKLLHAAEQSPTVTVTPQFSDASSSGGVDRPRDSKDSSAGSGLLTPDEARRVRQQVIRDRSERKQSHSPVASRKEKREFEDLESFRCAPPDSQRDSSPQDMRIAAEAVQLNATEVKQLCKEAAEAQGSLQNARSEVNCIVLFCLSFRLVTLNPINIATAAFFKSWVDFGTLQMSMNDQAIAELEASLAASHLREERFIPFCKGIMSCIHLDLTHSLFSSSACIPWSKVFAAYM